jgi:RNA recognition motif-containing protein
MASKLYVGGLPYSTTSEELRQHFGRSGTVLSADVVMDRFSGQSRGFGFVEMSTEAEAKAAITMFDGQPFGGRRLRVEMSSPQGARTDRSGHETAGTGRGSRTSRW